MTVDPAALADFESELQAVQTALNAASDELGFPLGELVRAQVKQAAPPIRAALVLAVGYDPAAGQARRRRILLAAALEMLYVALHVHRLLVDASRHSSPDDLDHPFIGSTILAGDYCFSRAASMVAQTDQPTVVATFAQALQTVSEGQLRSLFDGTPFDENHSLLLCGAEAAVELAGLNDGERGEYAEAAAELVQRIGNVPPAGGLLPAGALAALSPLRRARWQALGQWRMSLHSNGRSAGA